MSAEHPFLKFILSAKAFDAVKAGTKRWCGECLTISGGCGHIYDLWDAGGIRFIASGEKRWLRRCSQCGKVKWHRIRRKTDLEVTQLP